MIVEHGSPSSLVSGILRAAKDDIGEVYRGETGSRCGGIFIFWKTKYGLLGLQNWFKGVDWNKLFWWTRIVLCMLSFAGGVSVGVEHEISLAAGMGNWFG